jgi:SAM-dependent methyltransferase
MAMSKTPSINNKERWFTTDEQFNQLYPPAIRLLSQSHFTPLNVAKKAANFLAPESNVKILDIGSGVGKFCLTAAKLRPDAVFYGVEQRKELIDHADKARKILGLKNVSFIHGNFTQIDLRDYNHFYFFNSFYENLTGTNKIDNTIDYSSDLYNAYNLYLHAQLAQKPPGTRLVTYHSLEDEIPKGFQLVHAQMENLLKYWIKI